jgi:2-polyprenyl-6-methoxyphenol hydroxylase-like FAD-dependent oxidoreductase
LHRAVAARFHDCTDANGAGLDKVAAFGAVTNQQPHPGVLLAQEPDAQGRPRWMAPVGGFAGDHVPASLQTLRDRALDIGLPELAKVTYEAGLIGWVIRDRMPHSQRRRYERQQRLPAALLAMGDAITRFNPIYGQGLTLAACESLVVRQQLECQGQSDPHVFFRAAAKVVDTPLATGRGR